MINPDAYILIGGRSSRLGRDKATVDLGGQTLAQRAYQTVSEALPNSRVTFIAASEAQFAVQAILAGGRFIFDLVPGRGPLGGLNAALGDAQTPWIFVLACDFPFMTAELINLLGCMIDEQHSAVVAEQSDGRLQPLCAFYETTAARPIVQAIMDRPRVPPPLHEIVKELNPLIIGLDRYAELPGSNNLFLNVNNESELDIAGEIERKLSADLQIQ
jgi:molybdopterin-guanine dinucleotide biosynthesis protein A